MTAQRVSQHKVLGFNTPSELQAHRMNRNEQNRLLGRARAFDRMSQRSENLINNQIRRVRETLPAIQLSSGVLQRTDITHPEPTVSFMYGERLRSRNYGRQMTLMKYLQEQQRRADLMEDPTNGLSDDDHVDATSQPASSAAQFFEDVLAKVEGCVSSRGKHFIRGADLIDRLKNSQPSPLCDDDDMEAAVPQPDSYSFTAEFFEDILPKVKGVVLPYSDCSSTRGKHSPSYPSTVSQLDLEGRCLPSSTGKHSRRFTIGKHFPSGLSVAGQLDLDGGRLSSSIGEHLPSGPHSSVGELDLLDDEASSTQQWNDPALEEGSLSDMEVIMRVEKSNNVLMDMPDISSNRDDSSVPSSTFVTGSCTIPDDLETESDGDSYFRPVLAQSLKYSRHSVAQPDTATWNRTRNSSVFDRSVAQTSNSRGTPSCCSWKSSHENSFNSSMKILPLERGGSTASRHQSLMQSSLGSASDAVFPVEAFIYRDSSEGSGLSSRQARDRHAFSRASVSAPTISSRRKALGSLIVDQKH